MLAPLRSVVQHWSRIKNNTWRECLLLCGMVFNIGVRASLRRSLLLCGAELKKHLAGMLAPLRTWVHYRSACFSAEQNFKKKHLAGNLAPLRNGVHYRSACFSAVQK